MPTTTVDPETQVNQKVTFVSRSPNQILTLRPTVYITTVLGQRQEQTQEMWIREQEALNTQLKTKGLDPEPIDRSPWKVEFENCRFETDDPVLIERLRSHRKFNFPRESGFYELGNAPDEPKPTPAEQNTRIARAAVRIDIDDLEALIAEEKATHNRTAVIMGAEAALAEMDKVRAEIGSESEDDPGAGDESRSADD